jgi:hypothetical protein
LINLAFAKFTMKNARKGSILGDCCGHGDIVKAVVLISTLIWIVIAFKVFLPNNDLNISTIVNRNLHPNANFVDLSGRAHKQLHF